MNAGGNRKLAYLNSQYPSLSHTFIEREIRALRHLDVEIETFSIRSPVSEARLGTRNAQAAGETVCLLDSLLRLLVRAGRCVLARPLRCAAAFVAAQRFSPPGWKQRVRHIAYTVEAARLVTELAQRELRHVHVHMANNGATVAMLACRIDPALSYSLSIHGSAEFFHVDTYRLREKVLAATFVRCISNYCKAQVMAWSPQEKWRDLHVVHCGVEPDAFPAPARVFHAGPLRLVTVGRLCQIKGYPVLLEACARLSTWKIDWTLDIIGDGPLRSSLSDTAANLGITQRVCFRGAVAQDKMAACLGEADVMVVSSFMEGVPVVLMEAMMMRRAVVATRVGGIPELVSDGESGVLVDPASSKSLADALASLAHDRPLTARLADQGAARVRKAFNLNVSATQMQHLFQDYGILSMQTMHTPPPRVNDVQPSLALH